MRIPAAAQLILSNDRLVVAVAVRMYTYVHVHIEWLAEVMDRCLRLDTADCLRASTNPGQHLDKPNKNPRVSPQLKTYSYL